MKSCFFTFILTVLFLASTFSASFAQIPWTKDANNPVMSGGASGTWNRHVFMATVLYNPDSLRYEMWFNGSVGPTSWRPYRIGFATSPDGRSWTLDSNPVMEPDPGQWDEYTVEGPMVIRENGEYKMWYTSFSPNNPGGIGYATSQDGITWSKDTLNNPVMVAGSDAWEAGGPGYCFVMPVQGDGYKMWYTGFNTNQTKSQIGYASSDSGIIWTKADSVNPVLTTGSPGRWDDSMVGGPQILIIDNVYHMWFRGMPVSGTPRQTGWATSIDGIHWDKYSDPVLRPNSGQWDGDFALVTTVIPEGDSLRMWYEGSRNPTGTYLWRIGHATAPNDSITGISKTDDMVVPVDYVLQQNYPNPFNPVTTIEFDLPKTSDVKLKIFNILGEEVTALVSEKLTAGSYSYEWDASNLASGVYLYRLEAEGFVQTRKMILMK